MPYSGLTDFISCLETENELLRIKPFVDPVLEITEITDRISKSGGKALLFENNGTGFPLLINAFGSDKRMAMAIGRRDLNEAATEVEELSGMLKGIQKGFFRKIGSIPGLLRMSGYLPVNTGCRGICQQVIHKDPDLNNLPVLKCWPHDGGRYITLPVVHTVHPLTGSPNAGMYRMQIIDKKTTAMHWQRHKTGAGHFQEWKKAGRLMPVSVTLGGDPVYSYAATAPLPENISEYILAGFLRKKKVRLVRCITNELMVPYDADIVIEGFVDPSENPVWEGPFGDHTGFYSLADWYPAFHVTCITHRKNAVYPATIVGIPPQEDAWLTKASEKIFLVPIKIALQPEITDLHMPDAGVAHNLAIVKINKSYPGQGKKVISSLFGAGQMMFTKYLVVVSGDIDIRNYNMLITNIIANTDFRKDLLFTTGPLDVLDHASDITGLGGKLGIDATIKLREEDSERISSEASGFKDDEALRSLMKYSEPISSVNILNGFPVLVAAINQTYDPFATDKVIRHFSEPGMLNIFSLVLIVDDSVDITDWQMVIWQVLGNTDPKRDLIFLSDNSVMIDGSAKALSKRRFPRKWPNAVCSGEDIIRQVDMKWDSLGAGPFIPSPSLKILKMAAKGDAEIRIKNPD